MKETALSRRFGLFAAVFGLALMLWGAYRNEIQILFTKAINICLECVGIG